MSYEWKFVQLYLEWLKIVPKVQLTFTKSIFNFGWLWKLQLARDSSEYCQVRNARIFDACECNLSSLLAGNLLHKRFSHVILYPVAPFKTMHCKGFPGIVFVSPVQNYSWIIEGSEIGCDIPDCVTPVDSEVWWVTRRTRCFINALASKKINLSWTKSIHVELPT